jgi:hypothetical protein
MLKHTLPQVLYNTRDPELESAKSQLYIVMGVLLDTAVDPVKLWVVKEECGDWDEQGKIYKKRATTFHPNDPSLCVSLEEVHEQVEKQVMVRAQSGFKYQRQVNPFGPPDTLKFEIQADGTRKEYR